MSRRPLAFSICLSVLLFGACAGKERRARPARKDSATITAQAWRDGEYSSVRFVSLDGQPLGKDAEAPPSAGTDGKARVGKGVTEVRVAPGRHEIVVRFAPVSVRRLDEPKRELPAWLEAPPALHSIAFDLEAGKTYVIRSRAWIRPNPDVPFADYPPEILQANLAAVPAAALCDVVWVVESKTNRRVACATFPDGCLTCEDVVPAAP